MALASANALISEEMKNRQQDSTAVSGVSRIDCADCAARRSASERVQEWLSLPPAAWSRILVLLFTLAAIKLVLLLGLRKHVYQIHWRLSDQPVTWLNYFSFYALVAVGVGTLIELGRHCKKTGVQGVRRMNLVVLCLALPMILLTLHEGDKNYLYPILNGVLPWSSLVPYLSMSFFFRAPFLGAWMLAYLAAYYVMTRLEREGWALWLTSVFAGLYWVVCMQEYVERFDDTWVATMFGVLALVLLWQPNRKFSAAWWLVPAGWTVVIWRLFSEEERALAKPVPYFLIVLGWALISILIATWVAKCNGVFRTWAKVVGFYFITLLLFANLHHPMGPNYNNQLGFSARFPHYFAGELVAAGLVTVLATLFWRLRPRGNFWSLDILCLGLIIMSLLDLRITEIMGVRLGWDLIKFGNDPIMMWRLAAPYLPGLLTVVLLIALVYLTAVHGLNRVIRRKHPSEIVELRRLPGWSLLSGFAVLSVLGAVHAKRDNAEGQSALRLLQSSPLLKWTDTRVLKPDEFRRTARELGINWAVMPSPRIRKNWNVVLIFQESTYNKYCSLFSGLEETQPLLRQYQERMEVFPNFFSNFEGSIHSRFAAFTGLYPIQDFNAFTLNRVNVKSIFEILHEQGYACSLFYSSFLDYTGFRDFLSHRGLDAMYDADSMPGERKSERVAWGLQEEETLGAIRRQIRNYATSPRPFFLTYVPASPHYPYDNVPPAFRKHKPGVLGDYTSLYLNALLQMDWVMASILDELKATGLLERTLVVITADHGELLGENRTPVGHGWKVTPELANIPLILLEPGRREYRVNRTIGSQVDLLPTLLDCLGIALPAHELYQGRSLLTTSTIAGTQRCVYLNSYGDYGVIRGDCFWRGDRQGEAGSTHGRDFSAYQIENQGSLTSFNQSTKILDPLITIQRFERFQENLLRNYTYYRSSFEHNAPTDSWNMLESTRTRNVPGN